MRVPITNAVEHERDLREQWEEAHLAVHAAEEKARALALEDINRRLASMNELRGQLEGERGMFVTREWFDKLHDGFRSDVDRRLRALEGQSSNWAGRFWMLGALWAGVAVLVNLLIRLWK